MPGSAGHSSSGPGPRLRRLAYEPTTQPSPARCQHCGAEIGPSVAEVGPGGSSVAELELSAGPDAAVREAVAGVMRVILEALDGRRTDRVLAGVAAPQVCRYVRASRRQRGLARVSQMRSLRLYCPTEDVVEVAAVVMIGGRVRAVPARLERATTGWSCVSLRIL